MPAPNRAHRLTFTLDMRLSNPPDPALVTMLEEAIVGELADWPVRRVRIVSDRPALEHVKRARRAVDSAPARRRAAAAR